MDVKKWRKILPTSGSLQLEDTCLTREDWRCHVYGREEEARLTGILRAEVGCSDQSEGRGRVGKGIC
ncbi:MAG: hypothetical protein QXK88_10975 [Desulfurococcaceae archaeon]